MTEELIYQRACREFRQITPADLVDQTPEDIVDDFCASFLSGSTHRDIVQDAWDDVLAERPYLQRIISQSQNNF